MCINLCTGFCKCSLALYKNWKLQRKSRRNQTEMGKACGLCLVWHCSFIYLFISAYFSFLFLPIIYNWQVNWRFISPILMPIMLTFIPELNPQASSLINGERWVLLVCISFELFQTSAKADEINSLINMPIFLC